jgi:hypothetical protein
MMAIRQMLAKAVVARVRTEHDHGLRSLGRRRFCRDSGILSTAMASFEGTAMTADGLSSTCPWRVRDSDSVGFQLVLLGRRLRAVEGLLSVLFRLSSSEVGWATGCRVFVRGVVELSSEAESLKRSRCLSRVEVTSSFVAEPSPSSSAGDADDHPLIEQTFSSRPLRREAALAWWRK